MYIKFLIASLLLAPSVFAAEKDGVKMPDKITVSNQKLVLNGLGIRRATFFKVHVYVGGLYLKKKTQDPKDFLSSKNLKHINMHFVRDVDREDIQKGWSDAFVDAVPKNTLKKIQTQIKRFNDEMTDIEEGETIKLTFYPDKVWFKVAQTPPQTIEGKKFSRSLLSVWFINASDQGLRDGLLGK